MDRAADLDVQEAFGGGMLKVLAQVDVSHHHGEVTTRRGSASAVIVAPADAVFDAVIDPSRMTLWNAVMTEVVEMPEEMAPGSEWVVAFQAMRVMRWRSRSRCEALVRNDRTFVHRSGTDDGNPSYAIWTWTVEPERTRPKHRARHLGSSSRNGPQEGAFEPHAKPDAEERSAGIVVRTQCTAGCRTPLTDLPSVTPAPRPARLRGRPLEGGATRTAADAFFRKSGAIPSLCCSESRQRPREGER